MPNPESSSESREEKAIRAATLLGCERILVGAFGKLSDQWRAILAELALREPPHSTGILEIANALRDRRQAIKVHIAMKLAYMEHCGPFTSNPAPFPKLVELYQRSGRLEQSLRDAAGHGEQDAQDAIRDAQDEVEDFLAITRQQLDASRRRVQEMVVELGSDAATAPDSEEVRIGSKDAPYTVVSVDMIAYGAMSKAFEDLSWDDAESVLRFNRGVRRAVSGALEKAGVPAEEVWRLGTGDGEILIFSSPQQAVEFAVEFGRQRKDENAVNQGTDKSFRTGLASGNVCVRIKRDARGRQLELETGGTTIAAAVRIQSACSPNEIMMCGETYRRLSVTLRASFPHPRRVRGKPHENLDLSAFSTHLGRSYLRRLFRAIFNR